MRPRLALVESNTSGTGRLFARQATRSGVEPVLVTADPDRYRYVPDDRLAYVRADTADPTAVLAAVRDLASAAEVVGVTSSSEYYVSTAAAVAERLGLPAPRAAAVAACRDKSVQRRTLADAGVAVPEHVLAHDRDAVAVAVARLGAPVVVKPLQGSGSTGVRWCPTATAAVRHAAPLLSAARNERGLAVAPGVLVERCLGGQEYSVEMFGERVVAIVTKHLGPRPMFVETGHDVPAGVTGDEAARLGECARAAVRALGLGWGAAHVELRLDGGRAYIVEVNPRLAGGMIPELVQRATGVDLVEAQVRTALGRPADLHPVARRCAAIRFLVAPGPATVLPATRAVADALAVPGVAQVEMYAEPGRRVGPAEDFRGRLGHVIAFADDGPGATGAATEGLRRLAAALTVEAADRRPTPRRRRT